MLVQSVYQIEDLCPYADPCIKCTLLGVTGPLCDLVTCRDTRLIGLPLEGAMKQKIP